MSERIEQTTKGTTVTKWFTGNISLQTVIWVIGAFAWAIIFWKDSKDNWDKVSRLEIIVHDKAESRDLKDLEDKVSRQYKVNSDDNAKQDVEIEKVADWVHFQDGYKQAMDDIKNKK